MYRIRTYNQISQRGLSRFPADLIILCKVTISAMAEELSKGSPPVRSRITVEQRPILEGKREKVPRIPSDV